MWFTEDAWSPIIVIAVAAIVCFIAWSTTQRSRYLTAIAVLAFCAVLTHFVEQAVVTEGEKVEIALHDLLDTFIAESRSITSLQQAQVVLSERFFSDQNVMDKARVRAAVILVSVSADTRITDVQIQLTNQKTRAITHFRANGTVSTSMGGGGGHYASRWELTWQKEAGEWKITRTKMLNPMSGEEQRIPRVD
ncbi:MAG: hypothetical protein H8E37_04965 [Planctomycetes bacterium]|nr:hypothetical protein [Planctomycetota bacterium]